MKKKIAIITADYPLGVSVNIIGTALCLEKAGFQVDVFPEQYMFEQTPIDFNNKNIKVVPLKAGYRKRGSFWAKRIAGISLDAGYNVLMKKLLGFKNLAFQKYSKHLKSPRSLKEKLFYFQKYFLLEGYRFTKFLSKYINKEDYFCLIAIEPQALISATLLSLYENIPVIYYNMELLLRQECQTKQKKILKELEKECNRLALFTVLPDKRRAQYLIEDNQLNPKKVKFLPLSLMTKPFRKKTDYLYQKLNIPRDKNIILYAGNLSPVSMSLEVARAARSWPNNCVLVLHTWAKISPRDKYFQEIKRLVDNKKIYLSTVPVSPQKLSDLLSSAKIGLLFSQNRGPNSYEIASSSNKLVQYLRVGLPVISIDFPCLKEKIEKNGAGLCVKGPDFIAKALPKIMADYDFYVDNAYKLYKKEYNFSRNFKEILREIQQLQKEPRGL